MDFSLLIDRLQKITVAFIIAIMGGCSFGPKYPQNWPPLSKVVQDGCELLVGIYGNAGENMSTHNCDVLSDSEKGATCKTTLSKIFPGAGIYTPGEADRLTISFREKRYLVFSFYQGSELLDEQSFDTNKGEALCKYGNVELDPTTWQHVQSAEPGFLGYEKDYILLMKATDGSLIMKSIATAVGMALVVIPMAGSQTFDWYRFPALNLSKKR